jgi:hypothetical protein
VIRRVVYVIIRAIWLRWTSIVHAEGKYYKVDWYNEMPVYLQEDTGRAIRAIMFFSDGYWWITSTSGGPKLSSCPQAWLARGCYGLGHPMEPGHKACDFHNINWCFPATTGGPANVGVHVEPTMAVMESANAHLSVRLAEMELRYEAILKEKDARILSLEGSQSWSSWQPGQPSGSASGADRGWDSWQPGQSAGSSSSAWGSWNTQRYPEKELKSGWLNKCVAMLYAVEIRDLPRLQHLFNVSIGCM